MVSLDYVLGEMLGLPDWAWNWRTSPKEPA